MTRRFSPIPERAVDAEGARPLADSTRSLDAWPHSRGRWVDAWPARRISRKTLPPFPGPPIHLHNFGKQRLVINHRHADLSDPPAFFISNRLHWQAHGITRIRRHRWPVEVYHEEGNADGLDPYQVRDFQAISRHIALVAVTYSLLRAVPHDDVLLNTLQRQLKTTLEGSAGSCRRHTQAQALWALATFIATALSQGQTLSEVMQPFLAAMCA